MYNNKNAFKSTTKQLRYCYFKVMLSYLIRLHVYRTKDKKHNSTWWEGIPSR